MIYRVGEHPRLFDRVPFGDEVYAARGRMPGERGGTKQNPVEERVGTR